MDEEFISRVVTKMSNVDEDGLVVEELDGDLQPAGGARGERHRLQQSKVNINPKTKENREQYKREMLELLQPAFAAYHRSFKEHADKYVTEERITRFTKVSSLNDNSNQLNLLQLAR